jgi:NAD-dependent dihydropyrimidine dehydrogenase PreA subunit
MMTHVITSLCIRDGGCVTVCPVECVVPGNPQDEHPLFYIDPETCIDCGACIRECPYMAIFPEDEVPSAFTAKGGEVLSKPAGTSGYDQPFDLLDFNGKPVHLEHTRKMEPDEVIDLTGDTAVNADYFTNGPGYQAMG